jgi:Tol biopolymer transport system component
VTRRAGIALLISVLLSACASAGAAVVPAGPHIAYFETGESGGNKIKLLGLEGTPPEVLYGNPGVGGSRPVPLFVQSLSWSGDGSTLAFEGVLRNPRSGRFRGSWIFRVGADGGGLRKIRGTDRADAPVLSPDGERLAFARERIKSPRRGHGLWYGASVWIVDLGTGKARRLTPWRNGLALIPTSFSPDGQLLAVTRSARHRHPAVASVPLAGGAPKAVIRNAEDGVYSPDGSRIAFLRPQRASVVRDKSGKKLHLAAQTDLYVASADGTDALRETDTRADEVFPSWDPSGQRISYTRLSAEPLLGLFGYGASVRQVNADGSCDSSLLSDHQIGYFGAAWEPGAGREAGRIPC